MKDNKFNIPLAPENVSELGWFAEANNLLNEIHLLDDPPPVMGSKLDEKDKTKRYTPTFEKEELLEDDVDFIKNDPNYAKPNFPVDTNVPYSSGLVRIPEVIGINDIYFGKINKTENDV